MLAFLKSVFARRYRTPAQVFRGQTHEKTPGGFYRLSHKHVRVREFGDRLRAAEDEPRADTGMKKQFDDLWLCVTFNYENADGGLSERGLLIKSGFGESLDNLYWVYGLDSRTNEGRTFTVDRMTNVRSWGNLPPIKGPLSEVIACEVRAIYVPT